MSTRTETRRPVHLPSTQILAQGLLALAGGLALFASLLLGLVIGFNLYFSGQIYPGISVAGVNLSGMRPEEAQALLAQQLTYPEEGRIVFQEGDQVWIARPMDIGLYLDPQTSAMVAYQMGRQGGLIGRFINQFRAWFLGVNLPSYLVYDERVARAYLDDIAAQVEKPTVEASISVKGTEVMVLPGQVGRSVDRQATLAPLEEQLRSLTDGMLTIVVEELPPAILDASEQAQIAKRILGAPLTLTSPEAQEGETASWTFDQDSLAGMLTIERVEGEN
jgi:hypothetical protein